MFSLFINGLAKKIKEVGRGVKVGYRFVRLMYADDIVLLAESKRDLQRMLNAVTEYSRQWRFRVNPKKGKSEVMVFGKNRKEERKWWLAGVEIGETDMYKYLGIELRSGLSFKAYKTRILREAKRRMMETWTMGMRKGELPVKDCERVWQALVRPVLEYGAEIWGEVKWNEAEQVQREMGKMILRCSSKMANEVVTGELGWWSLKGRRDLLRLKFWGKIVGGMASSRLVKQVYEESRERYDKTGQSRWCKHTHAIMTEIGLEEVWKKGKLTKEEAKEWDGVLREKIHEHEQQQWQARMKQKPKLRTYRILKTKLTFEEYLTTRDKEARQLMTRLRGGTNELRIEIGRYPITTRDRRLDVSERRCLICMSGQVEDEQHFLLDCVMYEDLREKMFEIVEKKIWEETEKVEEVRKGEEGKRRLMKELMGEGNAKEKEKEKEPAEKGMLRGATLLFCKRAMERRNELVRVVLDMKT